jgi:UDP-N-acetylglucosamine--N-acetylmuramyl-(pentapeptide) pyrophosphoryl-undecaprenol N-acetylglucosamine transferase
LVPLPNVSHNHQLYNAKALEKVGAAKIILDNEINGEKLNKAVEEIVLEKEEKEKMGRNALKISTTDAEEKIYSEVKKLVK